MIILCLNPLNCGALDFDDVLFWDTLGIYAHMVFFLVGLCVLAYMTMQIKNKKILFAFLSLALLPMFFIANILHYFHIISSVLLILIFIHYISNYIRYKQFNTLLVLIAFGFILFGSIHFIISVNHSLFYVIGHLLELIAYILILINLIRITRK